MFSVEGYGEGGGLVSVWVFEYKDVVMVTILT